MLYALPVGSMVCGTPSVKNRLPTKNPGRSSSAISWICSFSRVPSQVPRTISLFRAFLLKRFVSCRIRSIRILWLSLASSCLIALFPGSYPAHLAHRTLPCKHGQMQSSCNPSAARGWQSVSNGDHRHQIDVTLLQLKNIYHCWTSTQSTLLVSKNPDSIQPKHLKLSFILVGIKTQGTA
jgi:hypothetical protein